MSRSLRVGIVGLSADSGWARASHAPAVQSLAGLELSALATRSQATADVAARAFGIDAAFGDPLELARHPDIDVVSVVVRAPAHREVVLAALKSGKHVLCEWPLGRNTAEAIEMAGAARAAGVHAVVGLQARGSSTVRLARELIASRSIGRLRSARIESATAAWGPSVSESMRYAEDRTSGVDLVTIQGAHTLDLAIAVLDGLLDVSSLLTTQFPDLKIGSTHEIVRRNTPDHMLVVARLAEGAALSIEVAGGRPPDSPFSLVAIGDQGVLTLTGGAPRGAQSGRFRVFLNGEERTAPQGELAALSDEAASVAGLYAQLRDDIINETRRAPDFDHAVRLSRLVDAVTASSQEGCRRFASDWPRPISR